MYDCVSAYMCYPVRRGKRLLFCANVVILMVIYLCTALLSAVSQFVRTRIRCAALRTSVELLVHADSPGELCACARAFT